MSSATPVKTQVAGPTKQFDIWSAPKSYRYKEEAMYNHAPQTPGIYYLVTFDEQQNGRYLYVGLVLDRSIYDALFEHWNGTREPKAQDLLSKYANLYFGFIVDSNCQSSEDLKDLYWTMVQAEKPELMDPNAVQHTGRYSEILIKEKSLL